MKRFQGSLLTEEDLVGYASDRGLDPDMALCANLRDVGVFMYATNREEFGHLIHADGYQTEHAHNDMWEMATNRQVLFFCPLIMKQRF